jgi:hypothetical protein
MDTTPTTLTDKETDLLLAAADLVTLARTAVERDYQGNVIDAHAPEMPTRFAKELAQIIRGAVAIGLTRTEALRLAIRCARDSMPPLRLAIIDDLAEHPDSLVSDVRKRLSKPRATVDRELQALHMLGVVAVDEREEWSRTGKEQRWWYYTIADGIDPTAIDPKALPEKSVHTPNPIEESDLNNDEPHVVTDKSGNGAASGAGPSATSATSATNGTEHAANGQTVFDFESALSDISDAACEYCGLDLNAFQVADGVTIHPDCATVAELDDERP